MSSPEAEFELDEPHRRALLDVARSSILHGLESARCCEIAADQYAEPLRHVRATFVTLRVNQGLRGCMGALRAVDPLVVDVARNAFLAAFRDPRFDGLQHDEFAALEISISVLSPFEPVPAATERELISQIRPGIDGLIVYEGQKRGTLLPSVWKSLPDPWQFVAHVKRKAGLADDYWSSSIRFERYTTWSIE